MNRLREVGSSVSKQYEMMNALAFLLIGAFYDAIILSWFADASVNYLGPIAYSLSSLPPSQQGIPLKDYPPFLAFTAIAFFLTLFPALFLSRHQKRVVPSFLMQAIGAGWVALVWSQKTSYPYWELVVFGVVYFAVIAGALQDELVVALLGKFASQRDMELRSLVVHQEPNKVKDILLSPRIRKSLGVNKDPEQTEPSTILFSDRKPKPDYFIAIELSRVPNENTTMLSVAAFDEGRYSLKWSEDLQEFCESKMDYIQGVLQRFSIKNEVASTDNAESVGEYVENRFKSTINKATESLGTSIFIVYVVGIVGPLVLALVRLFPPDIGYGITLTDLVIVAADVRRRR